LPFSAKDARFKSFARRFFREAFPMPVIRLSNGKSFESNSAETLLDAALRAQILLAYSCRTGRCGTCKARILRGTTTATHDEPGLTDSERADGFVLTCVRAAECDTELDIEDLSEIPLTRPVTLPCRIRSLERLSSEVMQVSLRFPPSSQFRFRPGQSIDVIASEGLRRTYSIANAERDDGTIDLQVQRVLGGALSQNWFEKLRVNDLLRIHGPIGTFFLREVSDIHLVFLATGTGLAPVKAMLEGLRSLPAPQKPRSISVYWGNRKLEDIYWNPERGGVEVNFIPVLSRGDEQWSGARGYVQDVLLNSVQAWDNLSVYACGSEVMIRDARSMLVGAGLSSKRFFSDAFVQAAEPARI